MKIKGMLILIFTLYVLLSFATRKYFGLLSINSILSLCILIVYIDIVRKEIDFNFLYFFIGLVVAPVITYFSSLFILQTRLQIKKDKISTGRIVVLDCIINPIYEELIWRSIFFPVLQLVITRGRDILVIVGLIGVNSLLFVFAHKDINNIRDFFETLLYCSILCMTCIYFPGMNYGLHVGRNLFICQLDAK
jgi:membrane protease YdiL (CAAX protease family)